jgi:SPP1 gp7 family putative phage head morphogenesis protein
MFANLKRSIGNAIFDWIAASSGTGTYVGGITPPTRGDATLLNLYSKLPWLHTVVNKISTSVASQAWTVYRVKEGPEKSRFVRILRNGDFHTRSKAMKVLEKQGMLTEVPNHPILRFIKSGTGFVSGSKALKLTQIYLDLMGRCAWIIQRDPGTDLPVRYIVTVPTWIEGVPLLANGKFRFRINAQKVEVDAKDVVYFFDPDPDDPYGSSLGTAKALGDELETDEYAAIHTKTTFYNKARPDVIISADGLSPSDTKRLEERWLEKHQGFWKRHQPHFLGKQVKVYQLDRSFVDMQVTELRKFERDTVFNVFGASPEKFGVMENSNRASIEAADYHWAKDLLVPRLEFQRETLQEQVMPQYDEDGILMYDSPIAEDKEHILNVMSKATYSYTLDEWRQEAGLPELPDDKGKVFGWPFNIYSAGEPGIPIIGEPEEPPPAPGEDPVKIQKAAFEVPDDAFSWLDDVIDGKSMASQLNPILQDVIKNAGDRINLLLNLGTDFVSESEKVRDFLLNTAGERIEGMVTETTRDSLRRVLLEGLRAGDDVEGISTRVESVFAEARGHRSKTIARSETVRAVGFGSREAILEAGIERNQWVATLDSRTRDTHWAMDGQIRKVDEPFESPSGATTFYPGGFGVPGEDINCRCVIIPLVGDVETGLNDAQRRSLWKSWESERAQFEFRAIIALAQEFTKQEVAVLAKLREIGGKTNA